MDVNQDNMEDIRDIHQQYRYWHPDMVPFLAKRGEERENMQKLPNIYSIKQIQTDLR